MKLYLFFSIAIVVVAKQGIAGRTVTGKMHPGATNAAQCIFEQGKGAVHFWTSPAGILQGRITIHNVPNTADGYHIHIHENRPQAKFSCGSLGPHFNPGGSKDNDLGDINPNKNAKNKKFGASASNHLHSPSYDIEGLTLDAGSTGIIGRSIAVHKEGEKYICCEIEGTQLVADESEH